MGAAAAAAIMIHKEKEIVAAFRRAGATAPEKATSTSAIGVHERMAFARLRRRAIVREASPGRYYLDELSWEAHRQLRRRVLMIVLVVAVIMFAVGAFLVPRL